MSIKYKLIRDVWKHPSVKFSEFIERHNLEIHVYERSGWGALQRFYAEIASGHVKRDIWYLHGKYGDGDDPEKAIEDLKHVLKGEILVIKAFGPARREIQCPSEWAPE